MHMYGAGPTHLPLTCLLLGACANSLLASQSHCTRGLHSSQAQQLYSSNHFLLQHVCSSNNQVPTILSSSPHDVLFWQSALQQEHADSAAKGRATFAAHPPQHCHANLCGCDDLGRPGLLLLDISHDIENRRIPVFNTVDDDQPPTGLQYIRYCHAAFQVCQHCAAANLQQLCFQACQRT